MRSELAFPVSVKTEKGKGAARRTRQAGLVPGVLYGYQTEPVMVTFEERNLIKVLGTPAGRNVFLKFQCDDKAVDGTRAIVKDLQVHPLKRRFIHADFFKLDADRELHVTVPIRLVGTPQGVTLGGILAIARRELKVVSLPDNLPEEIVVDVSALSIGQSIHVSDLEAPEGVSIAASAKLAICAVVAPKALETAEEEEEDLEEGEEAPEAATEETSEEGGE